MSTISSYCISNLLECIPYNLLITNVKRKEIPEIKVISPKLTASYYKEYLGFRVIRIRFNNDRKYIVVKGTNFIKFSLKGSNNNPAHGTNTITCLTIQSVNIEDTYACLKEKVNVLYPLTSTQNGEKTFTIKDCNGTNIVYKGKSNKY